MRRALVGIFAILALAPVPAQALNIRLTPAQTSTEPGFNLDIAVVAENLGAGASLSLGGYDLDISFDPC